MVVKLITQESVASQAVDALFKDVDIKSISDVIPQLPKVISWLELNYKLLQGSDKKDLVISVVNSVLQKAISDPNELALSLEFADAIVPSLIDEIVVIANSSVFKKVKKCFKCN